ncbi:hypothetical protein VSDKYIMU_CDS0191 [Enterococcus phage VRE9_4]
MNRCTYEHIFIYCGSRYRWTRPIVTLNDCEIFHKDSTQR